MKINKLNIFIIVLFACLTTQSASADTATETFDKAVASFNSGDYESALRNFQKAVGLNLNDVLKTEAYANIGRIYNLQGSREEAIKSCNKALELDSSNIRAYICKGNANIALGNNMNALLSFNNILKYDPKNINAYVGMGSAKRNLGDYTGAIKDYDKAISLSVGGTTNGEIMKAYLGRGLSKLKLGQENEGCQDLRMAGKLGFHKAYEFAEQFCN